jgi:hypothetical protein
MATLAATVDLYRSFRSHLTGRTEEVGFFLADYDPGRRLFVLRDWRPIPPEGFETRSMFHVTLTDEAKVDVIKWAWDSGASLVEAHSHGDDGMAWFSPSDLSGLEEWVPHLAWRLRGQPYAAIVTVGDAFDALAWIDGADLPEQVDSLQVEGEGRLRATRRTLRYPGGFPHKDARAI